MKSLLATLALVVTLTATATEPGKPVVALEGEVYHVGKTGLRIIYPRWHDPAVKQVQSETGEHYVRIATKDAGFYEGQRVAIYVRDGGTTEWNGHTYKRWDAVDVAKLPKGFRLVFPSEFGTR